MSRLYRRGACWYLDWFETGRRFRRSLGKLDRAKAQAVQAEKDAELAGVIPQRSGLTCADVIADYMRWYEGARPTSYKRAISAVRHFTDAFGTTMADSIDPRSVENWETAQVHRGAANHAVKIAKTAFNRAMRVGILRTNRMDVMRASVPPVSRAPRYYQPAALRRLYAQAHGDLWRFMANTGLRRGELFKATRADIRDGSIYIESVAAGRTKSGKWRVIPLNADARAALGALGDDRLVECAHVDTVSDWFVRDAKAAGVQGTLHELRHTFCTALVQSGVSLYDVKVLAGHSSITVTEKYAHFAPGAGRNAVDRIGEWAARVAQSVAHRPGRKRASY
jgi:integrase